LSKRDAFSFLPVLHNGFLIRKGLHSLYFSIGGRLQRLILMSCIWTSSDYCFHLPLLSPDLNRWWTFSWLPPDHPPCQMDPMLLVPSIWIQTGSSSVSLRPLNSSADPGYLIGKDLQCSIFRHADGWLICFHSDLWTFLLLSRRRHSNSGYLASRCHPACLCQTNALSYSLDGVSWRRILTDDHA
jgi:hypothetical protein